jgi:HD-GYP domain-containing protein (c-di-GMP phosphodiesterase class II)
VRRAPYRSLMGPEGPGETDRASVRLAELVAALSLGIDLGFGQPMEHVLRQCLIAMRMAEALGLDERQRAAVYYTALLINVGCHTDAHEQAKWFGDDIALKSIKYDHEPRSPRMAAESLRLLGSGHAPLHRFRLGLEFALSGHREVDDMIAHHAAIARTMAEQLALPGAVAEAIGAAYERWDGRGWPGAIAGEQLPPAARVAQVAEFVEVANRIGGAQAAKRLARRRRGADFDPALADLIEDDAEAILSGLETVAVWNAVIDAEPALAVALTGERFDDALLAIANFVDLKSPYFLGHARAVSELAAEAGARLGLAGPDVALLRRAGLVHGLGRLGVSNAILDKRGPLGAGERERVQLQPYLTDRMLRQSNALAPVARIAVQHRERLDGSGYPRGLSGAGISREGRILAAADAYQALREPRPHRPERSAVQAAVELRAGVRAGRLDADAVEAVLGAAGHRVPRRREGPAGLTPREVQVLGLLARGLSNKEIAARLVISPKTVANHAEHIYGKIDASTRAGAGLFAMRHGLLPEEAVPARVAA